MTSNKIKLSVKTDIINKAKRGLADGWLAVEFSLEQLADHINNGHPISYQFKDGYRKAENFIGADYLAVDIDEGLTIPEAYGIDFVKQYASLLHPTVSHTNENHRFRIIFVTSQTITDVQDFRWAMAGLGQKIKSDPSVCDPARLWYGCLKSEPMILEKSLNAEALNNLITIGKSISDKKLTPSNVSDRTVYAQTLIQTGGGRWINLAYIPVGTSIHCPMHNDKNASAFVTESKNGIRAVRCQTCNETFFTSTFKPAFDFYTFDNLVREKRNTSNDYHDSKSSFVKEMTPDIELGNYHVINEPYIKSVGTHAGIHLIKSPKGTGKTEKLKSIVGFFKNNPDVKKRKPVILIGHRQSLIREIALKLDLECYLDTAGYDTAPTYVVKGDSLVAISRKPKYYAICLDSLASRMRLDIETYPVVIIDESEQVFSHFFSDKMKQPSNNYKVLSRLIARAKNVYCLDADIGEITQTGIASGLDYYSNERQRRRIPHQTSIENHDQVFLYLNEHKHQGREIQIFNSQESLVDDLRQSLKEGKKCFIVSNSKNKVSDYYHAMKAGYPDKHFICITSDQGGDKKVQNFLLNIKSAILKYDAVFSSPSIGTGIDITFPDNDELIDCVYGFFYPKITTHFDIDQQLARVRHPKETKVWVSPQKFGFETEFARLEKDITHQGVVKGVTFNFDDNGLLRDETEHPFLQLCTTILRNQNASHNQLKKNFIEYKKYQGFNVVVFDKDDVSAAKGSRIKKQGKLLRKDFLKSDLLNAVQITHKEVGDFNQIKERNEKLTPEQIAQLERYWIEKFYHDEISETLVDFDNEGKMRTAIILNEGMRVDKLRFISTLREFHTTILDVFTSFHGIRTEVKIEQCALLLEVFIAAGVFDKQSKEFNPFHAYGQSNLDPFCSTCNKHKDKISRLFKIDVRKDIHQRATMQLGEFLKLVGLKQKRIKRVRGAGTESVYTLDRDRLSLVEGVIKKRAKVKADKELV